MPGWWASRSFQKHVTRDTASLTRLVRAARRTGADHPDVGWSTGREHPGLVQELVEERVVPVAAGPVVEQSSAAVRQLDAVAGSDAGDEAALGRHDQGDPLDGRGERGLPDGARVQQPSQGWSGRATADDVPSAPTANPARPPRVQPWAVAGVTPPSGLMGRAGRGSVRRRRAGTAGRRAPSGECGRAGWNRCSRPW